jgi:hypothetical protein
MTGKRDEKSEKKNAANLVGRDFTTEPLAPKDRSNPTDYDRNKKGVYGGPAENRGKPTPKP